MDFAVGSRIRRKRKTENLSQSDLAARVGISAAYMNLIEAGRRKAGSRLLEKIATELDASADDLDGTRDRHLVNELRSSAALPEIRKLHIDPSGAEAFAAQFPGWAEAFLTLRRAYEDEEARTHALSDRLNQDPVLRETFYQIVSGISAIRSLAEILESDAGLEAKQAHRFQSMIARQAEDLTGVATTLNSFFDASAPKTEKISAAEEVDEFLLRNSNYFPELEDAAARILTETGSGRSPNEAAILRHLEQKHGREIVTDAATARDRSRAVVLNPLDTDSGRRFSLAKTAATDMAAETIETLLERYGSLSAEARLRARRALITYTAGAILFPYDRFLQDAKETRCDLELMGHMHRASFEQVCHRLTTLRAPEKPGIPFGFMRVNPAGYVTKRYPVAGLPIARYGPGCPLWAAYRAFQDPGHIIRQVAEFPNGERFFLVAKAVRKNPVGFCKDPHYVSVMLACDVHLAPGMIYFEDGASGSDVMHVEAGPNCRLCPRQKCAHRAEDHIIARN